MPHADSLLPSFIRGAIYDELPIDRIRADIIDFEYTGSLCTAMLQTADYS